MSDNKVNSVSNNDFLIAEWNYEKNVLSPASITLGSNKKVWWKCSKCSYEWEAVVYKRASGSSNCPMCRNQKNKSKCKTGENDLLTMYPSLASEWNYEKNDGLLPNTIHYGTHKKIDWKCSYGHEWSASPDSRIRYNSGCPYCSGRFLKGFNDLQTIFPDIANEWNTPKNDQLPSEIHFASKMKYWWLCSTCGNEWYATAKNRTKNGAGCPRCMKHKKTSFPEQAIFYYVSLCFKDAENSYTGIFENNQMELDVYIPSLRTGIEYDGIAWHNNEKSIGRDVKKYELCKKHGIRLIRVSEFSRTDCFDDIIIRSDDTDETLNMVIVDLLSTLLGDSNFIDIDVNVNKDRANILKQYVVSIREKSIAVKYPDSVWEWDTEKNNGITPLMVNCTSSVNYWWKCSLGHSYQANPANKLLNGDGCPICSNHKVLTGFNDFASCESELLHFWDYERNIISPKEILKTSNKKVWWKCELGHAFSASPSRMVNVTTGCPICNNFELLSGYNDLKTVYPQIIYRWNYSKNAISPDEVICNSTKQYWWKCELGHEWRKNISGQLNYDLCPYCNEQKLLSGFNDLKTKFPDLASEWHSTNDSNPDEYLPSTHKKVMWKCNTCGNEWEAYINNRVRGSGCPLCGYSNKMQQTRLKSIIENRNTLADMFPEIASEWDYSKNEGAPECISWGADKLLWWICSEGHSFSRRLTDRTGKKKLGCPYCSGTREYQDLSTVDSSVIAEWDFDKNTQYKLTDLKITSNKKCWWKCELGHSYEMAIVSKIKDGQHCPYCMNKRVKKGFNDLQSKYPDIADEWNYEKNNGLLPEDVLYGSGIRIWWKCRKCNYEWDQKVVLRTRNHTGCPNCNKRRLIKSVKCLETDKTYSSIKEASTDMGISKDCIGKAASGANKTAGGFHWVYLDNK